jgi:molybdenum transport protein
LIEVTSMKEAAAYAHAGADGLQFDKVPAQTLALWVRALRNDGYAGIVIAAGGVTFDNVAAYAEAGVNGVASSWMYHGPGLDIGTRIESA